MSIRDIIKKQSYLSRCLETKGFPGADGKVSAIRETWVQAPGQADPLEKEMPTHSSTLAWNVPWTEEPGGL